MTASTQPMKRYCDGPPEYGLNIPAGEYSDEGVRFLRTTDIGTQGGLASGHGVFVSNDLALESRHQLLPGDLLFSRSGSLGRCLRFEDHHGPATFAGYLVRLRPGPHADARFLEYCAQSKPFQAAIEAEAITSTISNFNAERYASINVPDIPLAEQRAIADYLDAETARIDALIAKKQQLIHLLEERRARLTHAGVTGEFTQSGLVREAGLAWANTVPEHWDVALLRLMARQGTGHTPSRTHPEWWLEDECVVPWVTTGEVRQVRSDRVRVITGTRERISHLGIANSSAEIHPQGTVFLCRTASAGYSGIMGVDMATSQDFATWTCSGRLDPEFLLFCLRAMRADLLGRLATGSTHKTIYMPDIQALKIPVPTIEEQQQISKLLRREIDKSFAVADRLNRQIELLAEHRQALITVAVTGEFTVPGAA